MKNLIAEGLDSGALLKFNEHVNHKVEKCTSGRGMLEHAAAHDFTP